MPSGSFLRLSFPPQERVIEHEISSPVDRTILLVTTMDVLEIFLYLVVIPLEVCVAARFLWLVIHPRQDAGNQVAPPMAGPNHTT
jgi:hypothetical protein